MSAPKLTQAERDYQLSRPDETSTVGLTAYRLSTLVIVCIAVLLRMWGRRLQNIPLRSDDYTLIVAAAMIVGYAVCGVLSVKYGYGHHTLIVMSVYKPYYQIRAKAGYVGQLLYSIGYPLSRISLVLLYNRVFVKKWFSYGCWFMIGAYTCYAIATIFANAFGTLPVQAVWDPQLKPKRKLDSIKLIRAYSVYNIISDVILLVMPLMVIWSLQMRKLVKLSLSAVFFLGALTCVASIMRFYYTFHNDQKDAEFTGAKGSFWVVTELHLGLLCPCLVTFQPIIIFAYRGVLSRLSPHNRDRVSRFTGVDATAHSSSKDAPSQNGSAQTQFNSTSLKSKPSDIEAPTAKTHDEKPPPLPSSAAITKNDRGEGATDRDGSVVVSDRGIGRDESGMALDQTAALANLDPRAQGQGRSGTLGTSAMAEAGGLEDKRKGGDVGASAIHVESGWGLEREKGS